MARRRVEVDLILNARNYLDEDKRVLVATKATEVAVAELGDETDDLSHDMAQLAANTDVAKRQVDDFGDEARGSARDLGVFENRVDASTRAVLELAAALALANAADGSGPNVDAGNRGGAGRVLRSGVSAGGGAAGGILDSLGSMSFRSKAIGALVAIAIAAAPHIGALIAGAVTTAVGTIGLAGGSIAAAKNPAVRQAASEFGSSISTMFFNSGEVFAGRIVSALDILKRGFADLDLESTWATVAPYVEVVAKGLAGMGREFMPRFRQALLAARPALEIFAQELPQIGASLGYMFEVIAKSKGTLLGARSLFVLLGATLRGLGNIIATLANIYYRGAEAAADFLAVASGVVRGILGQDNPLSRWFEDRSTEIRTLVDEANVAAIEARDLADGILDVGEASESTADSLARLTGEFDSAFDAAMNLRTANLDFKDALAELRQAIADNGRTLDENSQRGRDNERALLAAAEAAKKQRDAMIESGVNAQTANLVYLQNIAILEKQAIQAGLSKKAVEGLTAELKNVPKVTIAILRLQFEQSGTMLGEHSGLRADERRAGGGPVRPGVPYIFGENGPEIGMFGQSGYMYSNAQSAAIAEQWQSAPSGAGFNHAAMAAALATALSGAQVVMDGQVVGQLITDQQNSSLYAGQRV